MRHTALRVAAHPALPPARRFGRRPFLVGALGAAAALAAGGSSGPARAAAPLRRIIDLGAGATIHPGSAGDYRFHGNAAHVAETGASWIRLWADWPSLQPDPRLAIDDPAQPAFWRLRELDAQIAAANADGVKVLLLAYRFPVWANGTEALAAQRNTDAEVSFAYADRMTPAAWERYVAAGRDPARFTPSRRELGLRIPPEGLGPESAWGRFFAFLYERYRTGRPGAGPRVDGLELTNEPNFQWWPQREASANADPFALGALFAPRAFAEAMRTAQALSARHAHDTLLFGPSTADSEQGGRTVTNYEPFTIALLDALDAIGYRAHDRQAWAHHNYLDLEGRDIEPRVQRLRGLLRGRWSGYAEGDGPTVFITEGGVRLQAQRTRYPTEDARQAQAASWRLAFERYARDDGPGAGVAMLAQYTTYADPRFDCGLLEPWPSTVRRPVYDVWATLPRHA